MQTTDANTELACVARATFYEMTEERTALPAGAEQVPANHDTVPCVRNLEVDAVSDNGALDVVIWAVQSLKDCVVAGKTWASTAEVSAREASN